MTAKGSSTEVMAVTMDDTSPAMNSMNDADGATANRQSRHSHTDSSFARFKLLPSGADVDLERLGISCRAHELLHTAPARVLTIPDQSRAQHHQVRAYL